MLDEPGERSSQAASNNIVIAAIATAGVRETYLSTSSSSQMWLLASVSGNTSVSDDLDGRAHPSPWTPTGAGHSVGHFEGDALVVETTGFTAGAVTGGGLRTPATVITERFLPAADGRTMTITYTWTDPAIYEQPHTYHYEFDRAPGNPVYAMEEWCDASDPVEKQSIVTGADHEVTTALAATPGAPSSLAKRNIVVAYLNRESDRANVRRPRLRHDARGLGPVADQSGLEHFTAGNNDALAALEKFYRVSRCAFERGLPVGEHVKERMTRELAEPRATTTAKSRHPATVARRQNSCSGRRFP